MPSRKILAPVAIATILVALCVAIRMAVRDGMLPPNFSAVAACAIFAGFLFRRNLWAALGVPLAAMILSDAVIGGYEWRIMLVVYAALLAPVFLGRWVGASQPGLRRAAMVPLSSLGASVLFFVSTNMAEWMFGVLYPPTPAGLAQCFISALPFFRYTVLGDMVFVTGLFGLWAAVAAIAPALARTTLASRMN